MKKLLTIVSLLCISLVAQAQIQPPDTLQLSPKELFGESDNWNDVGILQSKAYSLGNKNKYHEAMEIYDKLLEINPRDVEVLKKRQNELRNLKCVVLLSGLFADF